MRRDEPDSDSAEAHELDALDLDDAKAILYQLGYFAEDTIFMSMRLTRSELASIQNAMSATSMLASRVIFRTHV